MGDGGTGPLKVFTPGKVRSSATVVGAVGAPTSSSMNLWTSTSRRQPSQERPRSCRRRRKFDRSSGELRPRSVPGRRRTRADVAGPAVRRPLRAEEPAGPCSTWWNAWHCRPEETDTRQAGGLMLVSSNSKQHVSCESCNVPTYQCGGCGGVWTGMEGGVWRRPYQKLSATHESSSLHSSSSPSHSSRAMAASCSFCAWASRSARVMYGTGRVPRVRW